MTYESDIANEDMVYLITDTEQLPRMVLDIKFKADGGILYGLMYGTHYSEHYRCELSKEINEAKRLGFEKKEE